LISAWKNFWIFLFPLRPSSVIIHIRPPPARLVAFFTKTRVVGSVSMKMRLALLIPLFAVSTLALAQGPPGKEFKGHTGLVFSVAFSPDGKVLATASFDNTIKLWDFATGKELQTLKGHTSSVYGVAFSPDGTLLASGSQDKTIRLWNPKDGKLIKELKGHGDIVNAVAFSNDGKTLASAGSDKTVRLWNPADGKEIKNLGSHKESVYTLAFSPDNSLLASGSKDTTIKLWDLKAMKEVRTMPPPEPMAKPEPKKEMKKEAKDKKDKKTDKKEEKKKDEPKKIAPVEVKEFRDAVTGVTFSADGKQIISVGCDNMLRVWNVADGKEVKKIGPTPDWIFGLAVSRDKKSIATAGYGGHLFLWDLNTGKSTYANHLKKMITYCVVFTPDGKALVTGHERDNAALVTPLTAK